MALFEIVHGLSALLGFGATVGLFGPWTDKFWELKASMWVGAIGAIASGTVITLSYVGRGGQFLSPPLLAKVILSVVLVGVMYATFTGTEAADGDVSRTRILGLGGLWLVLLALGVVAAT